MRKKRLDHKAQQNKGHEAQQNPIKTYILKKTMRPMARPGAFLHITQDYKSFFPFSKKKRDFFHMNMDSDK